MPDAMSWRQSSTVACMDTAELNTRPSASCSLGRLRVENRENRGRLHRIHAGSRSPLTVRSCPSERQGSARIKRGRQAAAHAAAWFRAQGFNRPPRNVQRADCRGGQAGRSEARVFRHWQLSLGHRPDGAHLVVLQPLLVDGAVQAEQVAELCGRQQAWREAAAPSAVPHDPT